MNIDSRLIKIDALLRQVVSHTWASLPEERRCAEELQNETLRMLARCIDNFFDDQQAFDAKRQRDEARGRNPYAHLRDRYANAGKAWTAQEDDELRRLFEAGNRVEQLAPLFARTPNGIRVRLERLQLIEPQRDKSAA
ncbi:MAG: hypothetical protein JO165_12570 [Candidatus Eremiobacteraeota bacterium]|nr:hypothetical protein [Candidatus Eremiobacteraeota bacterium]